MAKHKAKSTGTFVIMALLILGLAGFGVTNFGGAAGSVATVGQAEVGINDYARAIFSRMQGLERQTGQSVTFQDVRNFGLDSAVLAQLINSAAVENEAATLGISAGDETVGDRIRSQSEFHDASGEFDRQVYEFTLERAGLNASDFEADVRKDVAEELLRNAVLAGTQAPDILVDTLFNHERETRDVTWARLTAENLDAPIPNPAEDELASYHRENPDPFTRPETKTIRYALLTPDDLAQQIDVDDEQLRALYDSRIGEFVQPERRLVERLVFTTDTQAAAARTRIDSNEISFDALVAERGLDLSDVDLGDVAEESLGEAAAEIFALEAPGVVGPLPSELGPALYRMNGILASQETTFEDAREALRQEAALDRARRQILELVPDVEDLLAGGADMAMLAERTDMKEGRIEWNEDVFDGIAAYAAFRAAGAQARTDTFPEVVELEDGGIFAMTVDEIHEPELRPLSDVREEVTAALIRTRTEEALMVQAEELADQLRAGREMAALDLELVSDRDLPRNGFVDGTAPGFIEALFDMRRDEIRVLPFDGEALLMRLDTITKPDLGSPDTVAERDAFATWIGTGLSGGILNAYTQALVEQAEVEVDQAALNAVHAQLR
ncbi:MAG: peptidylprolyl isomerase [Boseongicola sp. SB0677_bin_26]|nr:peptidylprolyl isomerase [Boseongicola sp. SB0665_bin_10]MYG27638.1 peptidylprolyl isomerase [Boseongicola sp. SB0677_bin_26]